MSLTVGTVLQALANQREISSKEILINFDRMIAQLNSLSTMTEQMTRDRRFKCAIILKAVSVLTAVEKDIAGHEERLRKLRG
jgi:hypothetical protein